jgi:subtilisin-like proprotein convertase family protein
MQRFVPLVVVLLVVASAGAAQGPRWQADDSERLGPETRAAYARGEQSFRVIVHVDAAPEAAAALSERGVPLPPARLAAVREAITQELGEIRTRLGIDDLRVTGVFELEPAYAAQVSRAGLEHLLTDPGVRFIEDDIAWHVHTAEGISLIHADQLHLQGVDGTGVAVAIIDTGIDASHPTLSGKVVYSLDTADEDGDASDCETHGTAVASIAAGRPYSWSSQSFAGGVAPGASILAYKASKSSDCGTFYLSDVVQAIQDAITHRDQYNVVAINLSLGSTDEHFPGICDSQRFSYARAAEDAVRAGIAVVASAGNEAKKVSLSSPACVSNAISVGSVYDTTRGSTISYCGDNPGGDCAPYLCTDTIRRKQVTCYSNSSRFLDLLAPAELVRGAKAGGTLEDFGGTSAAAPYVTGSIALLFAADPTMTPQRARLALELTGEPISDTANGIVTPLIDVAAAVAGTDLAVGEPAPTPIPDATGLPLLSYATVTENGWVTSVRVLVQITHSRPSDLAVDLISPEGIRVRLHDHTDGTVGANGLHADYPDPDNPAQSLSRFAGALAHGTWRLEVLDDRNALSSGTLTGWALQLELTPSPAPPDGAQTFIAVGAHATGERSTFWVTDLRLFNRSLSESSDAQIYYVPRATDGRSSFKLSSLSIGAGKVVSLPDVLATRFGVEEGAGSLLIRSDSGRLSATSRTYNSGSSRGTFGQFIGGTTSSDTLGAGDAPRALLQLANGLEYRTNVGFSEVTGNSATVAVTLYDGDSGAPLGGPATFDVPPFSNLQLPLFSELGVAQSRNAFALVEVTEGNGRVLTYASVIDSVTGDAIYVPGSDAEVAQSFVIPVVAKIGGLEGTNWISDARVYNPGPEIESLDIEFRPEKGTSGATKMRSVLLDPGRVLALDDILGSLFGLSRAVGSLRIAVRGGSAPLLVTSRTYNLTADGTYGQFIPAVSKGFGAGSGAAVVHLDATADFRTNIGVCEVGGGQVTVRYALKDGDGVTQGVGSVSLGPYEMVQIDGLAQSVGAPGGANLRVDFFHDGGDGQFVAYGSVVDNSPEGGDAIYVPAAGL